MGWNLGRLEMYGGEPKVIFDAISTVRGSNTTPVDESPHRQQFTVPEDKEVMKVEIWGCPGGFGTMFGPTIFHRPTSTSFDMEYDDHPVLGRLYRLPAGYPYAIEDPVFPYSALGCSLWIQFALPVTPGEVLDLYVGSIQIVSASDNSRTDGGFDNGAAGSFSVSQPGTRSAGGGSTSIRPEGGGFRDSKIVVGGGGGKGDSGVGDFASYYGTGGTVGGGAVGLYSSQDGRPWGGSGGYAATTSAPGLGAGLNAALPPANASAGDDRYGGYGTDTGALSAPGGGGGGGWYGGGGSGVKGTGGGGSSYIDPASGITVIDYVNGASAGFQASFSVGGGRIIFYL